MEYRLDKYGNKLSVLGMGCMRFPRDRAETEQMLMAAIDGGVNFFDTAYLYPGSEAALGDILHRNNRRGDVFIATKLPLMLCRSAADFDRFFNESLRRLKTDYVDYYFMHSMSDFAQWQRMLDMGIEGWLAAKKASGQIRQAGFSYHGTYSEFEKVLDGFDWDFTMIQYNYYDENYQAGRQGLKAAAAKGLPVIIMEPLLGGRLANGLPNAAIDAFAKADPAPTPAQWAIWWLMDQPEVSVVLSGMTSAAILNANLQTCANPRKLTPDDHAAYKNVVKIFRETFKYKCTGCNYCLPCPMGINIPACLTAYNTSYARGFRTGIVLYATSTALIRREHNSPRKCNNCGKCEPLCPQKIPIRQALKQVGRRFEPLPLRAILALIRRIVTK